MSVLLKKFLETQKQQPVLLKRYIDDIFMLWPTTHDFNNFFTQLNKFHNDLKFTVTESITSINFLDLTIYIGDTFNTTHLLDVKTFQKPNNLYQYLDFTSFHQNAIHKGLIIGECIRYIRTNTQRENYESQVFLLTTRLIRRGYPRRFIMKCTNAVSYNNRNQYITPQVVSPCILHKPIFKTVPLPKFTLLKQIILKDYHTIRKYIKPPLFIFLKHKNLRQIFIKAQLIPTGEQFIDIYLSLPKVIQDNVLPVHLPTLSSNPIQSEPCNHPRCATCSRYNRQMTFTSTSNKKTFCIRHSFTCSSTNVIYLITCTKCKKQYVGKTTRPLRERINHHRTSIRNHQIRYINNHFNFPDHSLNNISVQAIDTTTIDKLNSLEKYWIQTLQTIKPAGLNYTYDL